MDELSNALYTWYQQNQRDLPWRQTRDPYRIWISEVILQQTRVEQGISYYYRFLSKFPDAQTLASASPDEVLRQWEGLGYYRRAINLHKAANLICTNFDGNVPVEYRILKRLPGIGDYTASVISSTCSGERRPALDGNVKRIITRLFNLEVNPESRQGLNDIRLKALELMGKRDAGMMNNAMMEFGALQCTPRNPNCTNCPLNSQCMALHSDRVHLLPVRVGKRQTKKRYLNYLVYTWKHDGQMYLLVNKRSDQDIWGNMYDFPLFELNYLRESFPTFGNLGDIWCITPESTIIKGRTEPYYHPLTHQLIVARFYHFDMPDGPIWYNEGLLKVSLGEFMKLAKPQLINRYLADTFPDLSY